MVVVMKLPYPPSENRYKSYRIAKDGKGKTIVIWYLTDEAKTFKETIAWTARAHGIRQPLRGRYDLHVQLYPQRPQDYVKRMRADPTGWADTVMCLDLGNCEKVLSDAMNGIVFEDDKWARRILLERMEPDGEARLMVRVRSIEAETIPQLELLTEELAPIPKPMEDTDGLPF